MPESDDAPLLRFIDQVLVGDSSILLKSIPDNSVHMVITSPPYYLQRDYGSGGIGRETSVEEYIDNLMQVFSECVRVVREDGHIVFNIGDKYESGSLLLVPWRFATAALERAPVKLINSITWVKLNPTPRQFRRRLVPSTEPFFDFVKSGNYYYNTDAFLATHDLLKGRPKTTSRLGQRYFRLIDESDLTGEQKELARAELQEVIDEVHAGKISGFRMKIRGIHAPAFGGQGGGRKIQLERNGFTIIRIHGNSIKRDVIESPVETIKGMRHPAIFPESVVAELVSLLSPPDGIILDPFLGSGTTAVVAKKLGRHFIGVDINPEYVQHARERLRDISGGIDYIL